MNGKDFVNFLEKNQVTIDPILAVMISHCEFDFKLEVTNEELAKNKEVKVWLDDCKNAIVKAAQEAK
jgi:hypothetical protein